MMYQIPGTISPITATRTSLLPRVATFVVIWLLLIVGYGVYRLYGKAAPTAAQAAPTSAAMVPMSHTQQILLDCSRHAEEAAVLSSRAQTSLRQSQGALRRLLNESEGTSTARALATTLGRIDAARQDLTASRRELELIQSNLQGETKQ